MRRPGWEWLGETYAALLFLCVGAMLLWGGPPSLTDYGDWSYQGALLHLHLAGGQDWAHVLKRYPVPNSAATLGIGLLCFVLPWKLAADAWICLQLGAGLLATRSLKRTVQGPAALWFVVPAATYLGLNFWYGFVNFQLGLSWAVLMAALLLGGVPRGEWRVGALLLVAFLTHMIPFAFCGLLVILFVVETRRWELLWQLVPAAGLSVWYLVGRFLFAGDADGQAGMGATVPWGSWGFVVQKVNSFGKSFGFVDPVSVPGVSAAGRGWLVGLFTVNAVLCAVMAVVLVQSAMAAYRERRRERFCWTAVLVMVPAYLLLPGAALGISDPGARVLQVALAVGVLLCRGRLLRIAAGCAVVLGVASVLLLGRDGFGKKEVEAGGPAAPRVVREFARVANHDQDHFYSALERGDFAEPVFPTGMFLNRAAGPK